MTFDSPLDRLIEAHPNMRWNEYVYVKFIRHALTTENLVSMTDDEHTGRAGLQALYDFAQEFADLDRWQQALRIGNNRNALQWAALGIPLQDVYDFHIYLLTPPPGLRAVHPESDCDMDGAYGHVSCLKMFFDMFAAFHTSFHQIMAKYVSSMYDHRITGRRFDQVNEALRGDNRINEGLRGDNMNPNGN